MLDREDMVTLDRSDPLAVIRDKFDLRGKGRSRFRAENTLVQLLVEKVPQLSTLDFERVLRCDVLIR